ncbi:MAG TPA: PLD nuclease N-terminal domain-containing protein [Ktedonobacteraceae bacterium]|nr:PLD nuclease N-terminal domain-containing protein [Ktedonobacteraceae bacterium]
MALLFLFFVMFTALIIVLSTVFWIWMLVDCLNNKGLSDATKAVWVLAIVFTHFLGAFCYLLIGRKPQPVVVYQYQYQQPFPFQQQPFPFQQPMGGMYQQGNAPRFGNHLYQAPFQQPYPPRGAQDMPHTSYQQFPTYPPYQPGNAHAEYIPYANASKPTELLYPSPPVTPPVPPSYQDGYQPRPSTPETPRATASGPWRQEDEPQAIYPELPQQELRQQPNVD